jgi:S-layer homology domain
MQNRGGFLMKRPEKGRVALIVLAISVGLLSPVVARSADGAPSASSAKTTPDWGTTDRILTHIPFNEFTPSDSTYTYSGGGSTGAFGRFSTVPNGIFWAVPHVPSGALLTYLELDYCDNSDSLNVDVSLFDCDSGGRDCNTLDSLSSGNGFPGCHSISADLTGLAYTMNNHLRELVLVAETQAGNDMTQLNGMYIGYRLQISPAPATATFGDVPASHTYFRAIEALAASGITGGCGSGNYCPDKNVTRGEMAAFLARALGLHFPD